ncbi:MAG: hypothetical protein ACR2MT_07745, partial [Aurantibacter sp.]
MSKLTLTFAFLVLILSCGSKGSDIDPKSRSIQDARNAYFAMDHAAAYSIFTNVWKDSTQTLDDLTLAGRYLAKMDWLFYKKNGKAH